MPYTKIRHESRLERSSDTDKNRLIKDLRKGLEDANKGLISAQEKVSALLKKTKIS